MPDAMPPFLAALRELPDAPSYGLSAYRWWQESPSVCRVVDDWNRRHGRTPAWCRFMANQSETTRASWRDIPSDPPTREDARWFMSVFESFVPRPSPFAAKDATTNALEFCLVAPFLRRLAPSVVLAAFAARLDTDREAKLSTQVPSSVLTAILVCLANRNPAPRAVLLAPGGVSSRVSARPRITP